MTFEIVRGSLGSLLLLWSDVERTARSEIALIRGEFPKPSHGISAVLRDWESSIVDHADENSLRAQLASTLRAQLLELLKVRNGLCHGLTSIRAECAEKPARLCWALDGVEECVDFATLQTSFTWLAKVPAAISLISKRPSARPGDRTVNADENRKWWNDEFGIALSIT